jgi:uncharacterized membrane protein
MVDERTLHDPDARAASRMRLRGLGLMLLLAGSVVLAAWLSFAWPRNLVVSALMLVPLALPLAGIVRSHRRTFAWATLCIAPYFVYGLTELVANPAVRTIALAMLLSSLGLMAVLVAYLRLTRPVGAAHEP